VEKNVHIFVIFWPVFANFATIKKTSSKNLSVHIILILDATFVPNLTFIGVLSPEISLGKNGHPHNISKYGQYLQ